MCRLFGFRASVPSALHRSLVRERNALREQAREHPDGWGLGWYVNGVPRVERGLEPAREDEHFAELAQYVSADAVVAHVRKASVGAVSLVNTHPFVEGPWIFAHNGTVPNYDRVRSAVEATLPAPRRARLAGETDSERCFHAFLAHLEQAGHDPHDAALPLAPVLEALAAMTNAMRALSETDGAAASLTFLVSNGRLMAASRRGRSLYYAHEKAAGVAHPEADQRRTPGLCHLLIASERISDEDVWIEVPEGGAVGVDAELRLTLGPLGTSHPG